MTTGDVPRAASIGAEVGWPGREQRFEFYVGHPFCEAVAAEVDGGVAGIGFGTRNGRVGWIGMVCVRPRHWGRRVGRLLTERVAERLEDRGCRTLVLTATEAGRPIYEKMGFATATFCHGYAGPGLDPGPSPNVRQMRPGDLPAVRDLDRRMTGEDRSHLLRVLAGPGWVVSDEDGVVRGYHLPVPWGGGPTIVSDPGVAPALTRLVRVLAGPDEAVRFWLASESGEGMRYLRESGFKEVNRLPRMTRGEPLRWRPESLWGVFSLGKG